METGLKTMENLERMCVYELKSFLLFHGISPYKIPRQDGAKRFPLKSDLLRAAQKVLLDIIAARSTPVTTSESPFQSQLTTAEPVGPVLRSSSSRATLGRPQIPKTSSSSPKDLHEQLHLQSTSNPHRADLTSERSQSSKFQASSLLLGRSTPIHSRTSILAIPVSDDNNHRSNHLAIGSTFSNLLSSSSATPVAPSYGKSREHRSSPAPSANLKHRALKTPTPSTGAFSRSATSQRTTVLPSDICPDADPDTIPPIGISSSAVFYAESDRQPHGMKKPFSPDSSNYDNTDVVYPSNRSIRHESIANNIDLHPESNVTPVNSLDEAVIQCVLNCETTADSEPSEHDDSDIYSTIETDDEEQGGLFATWTASQLRSWFLSQNVNVPQSTKLQELCSIARAHKMFMDINSDSEVLKSSAEMNEVTVTDAESNCTGVKKEHSFRQRLAPGGTSEYEKSVVTQSRPNYSVAKCASSSKWGTGTSFSSAVTLKIRIRTAVFSAMAGIFLSSLVAAILWLYRNSSRPYCDGFDIVTKNVEDGDLNYGLHDIVTKQYSDPTERNDINLSQVPVRCIPCPRHGICENGELLCAPSYASFDGRCIEDEGLAIYAEELASKASAELSDVVGQALCGHRVSRYVHWNEIVGFLRKSEINQFQERLHQTKHLAFNESKFDVAVLVAKRRLAELKSFDVEFQSNGELTSLRPTKSVDCRLRHFIWANLGRFLLGFGTAIALVCLRIKVHLGGSYVNHVGDLYTDAVDALRAHKYEYDHKLEDCAFMKNSILRANVMGQPTRSSLEIWKDVEKKLNEDPRILRASRTVDGVPNLTFEWAGRRRPSSVSRGLG